ncbi:MAG: hypothetical protein MJZ24_06520 [Paludibacteraceae bacterium]|nr:hypothetical protein [Candidatus Physcocola equi]MCQ2234370.1 hypothetical protein [Paludibacteraceae bacterium]
MQNFNNLFGKIAPGLCRLTMNGNIAVKTSNGYKTYNVKDETLTNVTNFCFDLGIDLFFVMPTNKVKIGDIILIDGKPKCVISTTDKKKIEVIDYETNDIRTIVPERHVFMGSTVFYGKITSICSGFTKGKGLSSMLKMMMASQLMGGANNNNGSNGMSNIGQLMAMSMMMGGNNNMFEGLFDGLNLDCEDEDENNDKDLTKED